MVCFFLAEPVLSQHSLCNSNLIRIVIHCLNLIVPAIYCNSKYPAPYLTCSIRCSPYFLLVHTEWVPYVSTHFSTQYRNSKWEMYQCSFLI